jgi:hypothetical protein
VIEDFFPGWTDQVVASGGLRGDIAHDVNWVGHGVTLKTAPSDLAGLLASRPVLEGHVRRRLLALPNIGAMEKCTVQGLVADDNGSAIRGVRIKVDDREEQAVMADLVVDASGRGSLSPGWLESLGYLRPEEEKIEIGISYTTRTYRRRLSDLGGKLAVVVAGSEPNWRNGAVLFRPRIVGLFQSAAISAMSRPMTITYTPPLPVRFRPQRFTTSSPMPYR